MKRSSDAALQQKGTVLIFLLLVAVPALAVIALAVDTFQVLSAKAQQENLAEIGAITALRRFDEQGDNVLLTPRLEAAIDEVEEVVGANSYLGSKRQGNKGDLEDGSGGEIVFGNWNSASGSFSTIPGSGGPCKNQFQCNAVKLTLSATGERAVATTFARVVGWRSFGIVSTAFAFRDEELASQGVFPYRVVRATRGNPEQ